MTPLPPAPARTLLTIAAVATLAAPGCSDDPTSATPDGDDATLLDRAVCDLPRSLLASGGVAPNGIPALTRPTPVDPDHPDLGYLSDDSRVLGVVVDGVARAYPHNILWWHEIVNDTLGGREIVVTFCPLTGSGLVFEGETLASRPGQELDMGVSGLLFANNLVMYDRRSRELFGPQMSVAARCGDFRGTRPELHPVLETSWARWQELHPRTTVLSEETGYTRKYRVYPYGSYDAPHNAELSVPMEIDRSRPPKERVLGIRSGEDDGLLFPFGLLREAGARAVRDTRWDGAPVTVFFERAHGEAAAAFRRVVAGDTLTFRAGEGGFVDRETGSVWGLHGRAVDGPLRGSRLEPVSEAYVAFWFAWRHFHPRARIDLP